MSEKAKLRKIKRYCVKGNNYVILGVLIAGVIAMGALLLDGAPLMSPYTLIVLIVCGVLGGGLYLVGFFATGGTFKSCVKRLEKMGVLEAALSDLTNGESVNGGKYIFGKRFFARRGYGFIFLIQETDRIYYSDPNEREDHVSFLYIVQGEEQYSVDEASAEKLSKLQNVINAFESRKQIL